MPRRWVASSMVGPCWDFSREWEIKWKGWGERVDIYLTLFAWLPKVQIFTSHTAFQPVDETYGMIWSY